MFTREQQMALQIDKNLVVSASAGSGKTRALVERFVRLLLLGVEPKHIVAITFTKKAAAEMMSRAAEQLERLYKIELMNDVVDENAVRNIRRIRERLNTSNISTIHSFCSALLRDYPSEAELPPNFGQLDDYEKSMMTEETIYSVSTEFLQSDNEEIRSNSLKLYRTFGIETVNEQLQQILSHTEYFENLEHAYSCTDEEILTKAMSEAEKKIKSVVRVSKEVFSEAIDVLIEYYSHSGKLTNSQQSFYNSLRDLRNIIADISIVSDTRNSIEELREVRDVILTTTGSVRSLAKEIINKYSLFLAEQLLHCGKEIIDAENLLEYSQSNADVLRFGRMLFALASECRNRILQYKLQQSLLDYDDLQAFALKVLDLPHVQSNIRKKFRYIMVDEFQDTNNTQYQLVQKLAGINTELGNTIANIFIVGDPKQSIYRFRGADVRVFSQAMREIIAQNRNILPEYTTGGSQQSESEYYGDIRLSASFRMTAPLTLFLNDFFSQFMNSAGGYEVQYDETVCGRSDNVELGSVSCLFVPNYKKKKNEEENPNYIQERRIAEWIVENVEGENPLNVAGNNSGFRKIEYSDITVLSRTRSSYNILSSVFSQYGIPYTYSSGGAFFQRQEILDIVAYLSFLHNPADNLSFFSVLRSPFFGIADAELLSIVSISDESNTLWNKFLQYCSELSSDFLPSSEALYAREILSEILPTSTRLSIPVLINSILEKSRWIDVSSQRIDAASLDANVQKLVHIAREFESKGFKNLYDFVEMLKSRMRNSSQESDAQAELSSNSINLLTIHASKGLEFPVVILYDCAKGSQSNSEYYHEHYGYVSKIPIVQSEIEDSIEIQSQESSLRLLSKGDNEAAESAETKRLLYVALTRAECHLLITANVDVNDDNSLSAKNKGFFPFFKDYFQLDDGSELGNNSERNYSGIVKILQNGEIKELRISNSIMFLSQELTGVVAVASQNAEEKAEPNVLLGLVRSEIEHQVFSASQLMMFERNPNEYFLRYHIGLPEDTKYLEARASEVEDRDDAIRGSIAGSVLHAVMEKFPEWINEHDDVRKEIIRKIVEKYCSQLHLPLRIELLERITNEALNIVNAPLVQRYSVTLVNARYEEQLFLPYRNDFLVAVLDCLVQSPNGDWEIWDWKSNAVDNAVDMDELMKHYSRQMLMYIYFLSLLYPNQHEFTARLLFSRMANKNRTDREWTRSLTLNRRQIQEKIEEIGEMISSMRGSIC